MNLRRSIFISVVMTNKKLQAAKQRLESLRAEEKANNYLIAYNEREIVKLTKELEAYTAINQAKKHEVLFGIRPEDIIQEGYVLKDKELTNYKKIDIAVAELLGNEYYVHAFIGDEKVIAKVNAGQNLSAGDAINVAFDLNKIHLFDVITENRIF